MKAIPTLLLLGLTSGLCLGTATVLAAAETPPAPVPAPVLVPAPSAPSALTGKVVAVDKAKKSITVDIKGRVFVFRFSQQLVVRLNDIDVPMASLSPGQTISLIARRNTGGNFEIVALNIEPNMDPVAVAGGTSPTAVKKDVKPVNNWPSQPAGLPAPFRTEPNPANLAGGVQSPN